MAATLTAGSAALSLLGGTGTLTLAAGGTSGSASGTVALTGVPGLSASGNLDLTVDSATSTFSFAGTGSLALGGVLDVSGTLTVSASGTGTARTVTVALTGASLNATVVLKADGNYTASGSAPLSLPVSIPGVTLSGTASLAIDSAAGTFTVGVADLELSTPVGVVTGAVTISRADGVLTIAASASTSDTALTVFVGDRRTAGDTTDDIGLAGHADLVHRGRPRRRGRRAPRGRYGGPGQRPVRHPRWHVRGGVQPDGARPDARRAARSPPRPSASPAPASRSPCPAPSP